GVDDVRDQLVSSAQYPPYQGDRKIYIVDEAEKMTPQAQNALLKTIEEPPSYMMIMLLASHEESLLQTILSRCITLQLKPVPDSIIIQFLTDKFGADERTAGAAAALARGNPGRAIALFQSEEFTNMHAKTIELLKSIPDKPLYQLLSDLTDLKGEIDEVFETMKLWYRDVVIFKATRDSNLLIFKDEKKAVMAAADRISFNGLDEIQGAIEKAQVRLRSNVSFELTAMLLLTTLQEQSVMRK
ncbi:MAG: ATP-binding protein, partial [Lachnospiraceae bacterium]